VDGVAVGTATYGAARPDVCVLFPGRPGCPNVGYTYTLDTTRFQNGTHTMEVTSTSSDGKRATDSALFTISKAATAAVTVIETPNAGSIAVSGIATVTGYALKPGVAVNTVTLEVDNVPVGVANVNITRNDICATHTSPQCPNVGFTYQFDTNPWVDGPHIIIVVAHAADGTSSTTAALLNIQNWTAGAAMTGSIDSPSSAEPYYTGTNTFMGWFLEPNVSISNVLISIDGIPFGNATRVSRADVCGSYSSPDCPNVGWSFSLNTSLLTNDVHTFAATGTTANGQSFTLTQTFTSEN
jgi:N-acetylmuramoyl-L-alanine amidase